MRGVCSVCGRALALRKDGTVQGHLELPRTYDNRWCLGSWERPKRKLGEEG